MTSPDGLTYNQNLIIAITTLVLVLAYASYALRLYARRVSGAKVWWDDYMVAAGLFCATIPCVSNYVGTYGPVMMQVLGLSIPARLGLRYGFGLHADTLPKDGPEKYLVCLFTLLLAWMVSSTLIKIGILLFYYRLFPSKRFRWSIWAVGAFFIACFIAGFIGFVLQCFPVNSFWIPTSPMHCLDRNRLYLGTATLGLIGDVILLVQPIPIVWRLKVDRSRRIGVILVFFLGGLVCIISIARLSSLKDINNEDITFSNVGPGLWSTAEVTIGVVSANLPSMRPLFTKVTDQAARLRTVYHGRTESVNTGSSGRHTLRSKGFARMNDSTGGGRRKNLDGTTASANGLTSVVRHGRNDDEDYDLELGLPLHGIAVRTYVERRVENADEGRLGVPDGGVVDQKVACVAPWAEPVEER